MGYEYEIDDCLIQFKFANIKDLYPNEILDLESYVKSRQKIKLVVVDILGLRDPRENLSLEYSILIPGPNGPSIIETVMLGNELTSGILLKGDEEIYLEDDDIIDINKNVIGQSDPLLHSIFDNVTYKFAHLIAS